MTRRRITFASEGIELVGDLRIPGGGQLAGANASGRTPLLIVHGERDAYCSPALAQAVYDRKRGDKEILWLDAGLHTDLYDNRPYVSQAAAAAVAFLHRTLSASPPVT